MLSLKIKKFKWIALETQDESDRYTKMASTGTEATFLREEKMRCSKDPPEMEDRATPKTVYWFSSTILGKEKKKKAKKWSQ